MKKFTPKIILEGTRLTFKTEIVFALNKHPRIVGERKYRYHSPIISAEWCSFTNFPWGRGLINFSKDEEAKAMKTYETWLELFELQKYYSWIIDRFHISTKVYQKIYNNREYDFNSIEQRLTELGFHVVLLTRSAQSFKEAREERIKVSGNPSQYDDLDKFIFEQNIFIEEIQRSILPKFEIDISDNNISRVVEEISDWMERTGGLWAKD
ncbi:MAG: hypothetical protein FJ213_07325 [Ignavibacteria bacterium]|nr:hypothetical protein [Ignavibacteria bacterium]